VDVALGLPTAVRGTDGPTVLEWARAGEQAGFASLATTDRLVYPAFEGLTALAAAAAVTASARLTTTVLVAPARADTAVLAKQAATVDRLSGGRLVLGLAVGSRPDDFAANGTEVRGRGSRFEAQLCELRRIWAGERRGIAGGVGPEPVRPGGPELVVGGRAPAAIERAARHADGWISGAGPGLFEEGAAYFRAAWERAGRTGRPRLLALSYFALGGRAEQAAGDHLGHYYGFAPAYARQVLAGAAVGADRVAAALDTCREAGCDEVVFLPCSAGLEQVDLLHAVVSG
jgi:alkanesulfonate monooxygenase SsuD/methylene tetrahydromethanopterin reductase-like flavin-dependent oxidoreductase (luciferase family)